MSERSHDVGEAPSIASTRVRRRAIAVWLVIGSLGGAAGGCYLVHFFSTNQGGDAWAIGFLTMAPLAGAILGTIYGAILWALDSRFAWVPYTLILGAVGGLVSVFCWLFVIFRFVVPYLAIDPYIAGALVGVLAGNFGCMILALVVACFPLEG